MTSFTIELQNALRHATETATIARSFGYELPTAWATHAETAAVARTIADEPEPTIPLNLPAADKLPAFITKTAADRDKWHTRVALAAEIHERATRAAARVAIDHAPTIAHRLATEANDNLLPRLTGLLDTAPHTLGGHETPEELAAHAELLRVVGQATRAAAALGQLAVVTGEGADIGSAVAMLLIAPGPNATVRAVEAVIRDVANNGIPTSLDGWQALRPLNLSFAFPGEAAGRAADYYAIKANQMRTPDGGLADHTLGELAAIAATAGTPLRGYVGATAALMKTPHSHLIEQAASA